MQMQYGLTLQHASAESGSGVYSPSRLIATCLGERINSTREAPCPCLHQKQRWALVNTLGQLELAAVLDAWHPPQRIMVDVMYNDEENEVVYQIRKRLVV